MDTQGWRQETLSQSPLGLLGLGLGRAASLTLSSGLSLVVTPSYPGPITEERPLPHWPPLIKLCLIIGCKFSDSRRGGLNLSPASDTHLPPDLNLLIGCMEPIMCRLGWQ